MKSLITEKDALIIVKYLIADLRGRCGIGDEWDNIDVTTQKEIELTWAKIIREQLPAY